jgi:diacylglycerol kinase family enzyme
MMTAPKQDRLADDGKVTLVVMYGSGKLKTLMVFPSIFKGEHVNHTEMVAVHTGKEISVTFDRPTALQIDGETVLNVTNYKVTAGVPASVSAAEPATV